MIWYKGDLHIHTVLSPCAELSMGPRDIVRRATECGLDLIAITDHNSAENVSAVRDAAGSENLLVIPGMEVYTREEAHMICLFETIESVTQFQNIIYDHLAEGENDPDWYGPQYIVDGEEHILGENPRLLGMPTNLHVQEVAGFVIDLDGIIYPAHIDRKANSLLHALGFIPTDLPFYALEIARPYEEAVQLHRFLKNTPLSIIRSSDAHRIEEIGSKATWYYMVKPTFAELKKAIMQQEGRRACLVK